MIGSNVRRGRFVSLAVAVLGAALFSSAHAAGPSTEFWLNGDVTNAETYNLSKLEELPATTQTVSFIAGGGSETHTYTGVNLWSLLNGVGIPTDPNRNNDILRKYVVATGTDGYRAAFSLGEINPGFGNRPYFVAYSETINGQATPLTGNGFARIAAPGDVRGGRYVSNLMSLEVATSASTQAGTGGGVSTQFSVSGTVANNGATYDLGDLEAFDAASQTTQTVTFISRGQSETHTYTGVSLWSLLNQVGIVTDPDRKNDILGKYLVATGTDGYQAVIALGEINPNFGNQPYFVAHSETINGQEQSLGSNGFARLVLPGDVRGGRYVSNLISLEVLSAVPEPGTVVLMIAGLIATAALVRRRARTSKFVSV